MITKDSVIARKEELESQRVQVLANLHAIVGAMQDCDYWISKLTEEEAQIAASSQGETN
jgi:hypothetical protein